MRALQGTGKGMASANHPIDKVRALQCALYVAAKQQRQRRFHTLYDRIARPDVLRRAWEQVRHNKGAGIDGETLEAIEADGAEKMLTEPRGLLETGRYRPQAVRRGLHTEAGKAEGASPVGYTARARPGGADRGQAGLNRRNSTLSGPIDLRMRMTRSPSLRHRAIGTKMRFMNNDVDEIEASASSWDRRPLDY
jgi:hypothetical protein